MNEEYDEYVVLHIDDDDPTMPGPMFLRGIGEGITSKLDEAYRFTLEGARDFVEEGEALPGPARVTGVYFAVPDGYRTLEVREE